MLLLTSCDVFSALVRKPHSPPIKKRHPAIFLKRLNLNGHRRLGHAKGLGHADKITMSGHSVQCSQLFGCNENRQNKFFCDIWNSINFN
jgi:hypothetical protein